MADPIKALLSYAMSQGFTVNEDKSGYSRIYAPNGAYVTCYPATPGNEYRRFRDVATALRRHGLVWPAPSKKELRALRRRENP